MSKSYFIPISKKGILSTLVSEKNIPALYFQEFKAYKDKNILLVSTTDSIDIGVQFSNE
ncbi:hypothetical protein ENUP19_0040G0019 [Entamoeba nuttalli]|uniref:Uncharacterized protein n=1 Tax=Entamoeba nuttalli TaxID=412467 RepID=A0ABQ0DA98_9EUKA